MAESQNGMKTILIADDEEDVQTVFRMRLEHLPYRVLEAHDGSQALAVAQHEHPDLVILDWTMPGLSGVEIMAALRRDPATAATQVIMITGRDDVADQQRIRKLGAVASFIKPFSPKAVLDKILEVLEDGKEP